MATIAVIDFKTTGLSPGQGARATEIAAIMVRDGRIIDRNQSLMNAGVRVPAFTTHLTGITNAMVHEAPLARQVVAEVADFVGDHLLVARNASFCWCTFRSQVLEFAHCAERLLTTRPCKPTEQKHQLYEAVSHNLQREDAYAMPAGQKHPLILLVRKVLASSPYAVAGTLKIRRVLEIYQDCRTQAELHAAFEKFQGEVEGRIQAKMRNTRKILLEHFDEDVHERLKVNLVGTQERLDRIARLFWSLTRHCLQDQADFDDEILTFNLRQSQTPQIAPGRYHRPLSPDLQDPAQCPRRIPLPPGSPLGGAGPGGGQDP